MDEKGRALSPLGTLADDVMFCGQNCDAAETTTLAMNRFTSFRPAVATHASTRCSSMPLRNTVRRNIPLSGLHLQAHTRLRRMASHFPNPTAGQSNKDGKQAGVSLDELPKSSIFTSKLPPDPSFETPQASHSAPRESLGPRAVRGALYTFVRPEPRDEPELLGVSPRAMRDIGLKEGEDKTKDFLDTVAGNKIFWNEKNGGVYPWAQCYGGLYLYISKPPNMAAGNQSTIENIS